MKQNNNPFRFAAISIWAVALILVCGFIANGAWVTPTANPPAENISAPLNVGTSNQTKQGSLTISNALTVASSSLFQGIATFTPTANNENQFKITNSTGTELFKIDSSNNTATLKDLSIGANTMNFGLTSDFKLGIGQVPTTNNLEVNGTASSTGNITSSTGFCIGASCITEWPSGGEGGGESIPQTGIVLSQSENNVLLTAGGFALKTASGAPYVIMVDNAFLGPTPFYLFEKQ